MNKKNTTQSFICLLVLILLVIIMLLPIIMHSTDDFTDPENPKKIHSYYSIITYATTFLYSTIEVIVPFAFTIMIIIASFMMTFINMGKPNKGTKPVMFSLMGVSAFLVLVDYINISLHILK